MPISLSPRPSPHEVRAYVAGTLSDTTLRAAVHLLDRDPNWQVLSTPGPRAWDLTLLYSPEGRSYALHVERAGASWHGVSWLPSSSDQKNSADDDGSQDRCDTYDK